MSIDSKKTQSVEVGFTLPEGWTWTIASDVCSSVRDGTHDTPKYVEEGVPLITSKNLKADGLDFTTARNISPEDHEKISIRSGVENGDLLFAMIGTIGMPVVVRTDRIFSIKNVGLFKKNEAIINSEYLKYWLESSDFNRILEKRELIRGTTQKFIPLGNLRILPIPLSPLPEQSRIVDKIEELFTRLDAGVESLKKAQAQLRQYRQSVLKAAVEGRLTQEWREAHRDELEPASALLERIQKERREKWETEQLELFEAKGKTPKDDGWKGKYKPSETLDEDELPEIPEKWLWTRLGELTDLSSGRAFKKSEYSKEGVRLFQIANVSFGEVLWENLVYMPTNYLQEYPKLVLEAGDILMALNRPILNGKLKIGRLQEKDVPAILYQRVGRFDSYNSDIKTFLFYYAQSPFFVDHLRASLQGVDQPFVNKPRLLDIPVPLPPLAEQFIMAKEIERCLSVADEVESSIGTELRRVDRIRQSILKQAFTGKLVPQDPNDEPASVLLERIKAEKAARETEKKSARKSKTEQSKEPEQMELL